MKTNETLVSVRRARIRSVAIAVCAVMSLESCTSWVKETQSVPMFFSSHYNVSLRVTRTNGVVETLSYASMQGDSLFGRNRSSDGKRAAIAVADIKFVEARHFDGTKTTVLVAGIALFMAMIAAEGPHGVEP